MISSVKNVRGLSVEAIYHEQHAQLGRTNDTLYRMPPFFATVIGGLWYVAAQYLDKDRVVSAGIFLFATACGIAAVFLLKRIRAFLLSYAGNIRHLEDRFAPPIPETHTRITNIFMALLIVGVVLSSLGVVYSLVWYPTKCTN